MITLPEVKRTIFFVAAFFSALQFSVANRASAADSTTPTSPPAYNWKGKFVRVRPIDGLWWFTDPSGKPFLSRGVDNVTFNQDFIKDTKISPYANNALEKYKTQENWRQASFARLLSLNFNTLGAWSDEKVAHEESKKKQPFYYTVILHAADSFEDWSHSGLPDFYDPKFEESVKKTAEKLCTPHLDDDKLLGYFGDNELPWVNRTNPILIQYMNQPGNSPGRIVAFAFLKRHYANFAEFNRVWTTDFESWEEIEASKVKFTVSRSSREQQEKFEKDCSLFAGFASSRYFDVIDQAIKAVDPNHLNLGCRFMQYPGIEVLRSCSAHVDVVSFNCYEVHPGKTITRYESSGKPLLISEFAFRAVDSGLPNTKGGGPVCATQRERAELFSSYVKEALKSPYVVGYHWFEHIDQPKEGRFDGEDSNYGIADINDQPYLELTQTMKTINLQAQLLHGKAEQM